MQDAARPWGDAVTAKSEAKPSLTLRAAAPQAGRAVAARSPAQRKEETEAKWKVLQHISSLQRLAREKREGETDSSWCELTRDSEGGTWLQPVLARSSALPPKDFDADTDVLEFLESNERMRHGPSAAQFRKYRQIMVDARRGIMSTPPTRDTGAKGMKRKKDMIRGARTEKQAAAVEHRRRAQLGSTRRPGSQAGEMQRFEMWTTYLLSRRYEFMRWALHMAVGQVLMQEDNLRAGFILWCSMWVERHNVVCQIVSALNGVFLRMGGIVAPRMPASEAMLQEVKALMEDEGTARKERHGLGLREVRIVVEAALEDIERWLRGGSRKGQQLAAQEANFLLVLGVLRDKGWRAGEVCPGAQFDAEALVQLFWTALQRLELSDCEEGGRTILHPMLQKGEGKRSGVAKDKLQRARVFVGVLGDKGGAVPAAKRVLTLDPLPAELDLGKTPFARNVRTGAALSEADFSTWLQGRVEAVLPGLKVGGHSLKIGSLGEVRARTGPAALEYGSHNSESAAEPYDDETAEEGGLVLMEAVQLELSGAKQPLQLGNLGRREGGFSRPAAARVVAAVEAMKEGRQPSVAELYETAPRAEAPPPQHLARLQDAASAAGGGSEASATESADGRSALPYFGVAGLPMAGQSQEAEAHGDMLYPALCGQGKAETEESEEDSDGTGEEGGEKAGEEGGGFSRPAGGRTSGASAGVRCVPAQYLRAVATTARRVLEVLGEEQPGEHVDVRAVAAVRVSQLALLPQRARASNAVSEHGECWLAKVVGAWGAERAEQTELNSPAKPMAWSRQKTTEWVREGQMAGEEGESAVKKRRVGDT